MAAFIAEAMQLDCEVCMSCLACSHHMPSVVWLMLLTDIQLVGNLLNKSQSQTCHDSRN